jgi:hypothetical protein
MPTKEREPGRYQHRVQTATDVRRMLATQIESVIAHPDLDPIRTAHVVARLARMPCARSSWTTCRRESSPLKRH